MTHARSASGATPQAGATAELQLRETAEEAHRILETWRDHPAVPAGWQERMAKAADALPCGCGVPCPGREHER